MNKIQIEILKKLYTDFKEQNIHKINDLKFSNNSSRIMCDGLTVDFSRAFFNQKILNTLLSFANDVNLQDSIKSLFNGDNINFTEQRPAHHTALRIPKNKQTNQDIIKTQGKIKKLSDQIRNGDWKSFNNKKIKNIINIGIGGSDLGPRMVYSALSNYLDGPQIHFVANIDPQDLENTIKPLSQESTLFIISSKSFNTTETLENAITAREWLLEVMTEKNLANHMIAVSSNIKKAVEFGVDPDNILPMWDWVGGRYSIWSSIGIPIAIAFGNSIFEELLSGAYSIDKHFYESPFEENLPVLLSLLELWYIHGCNASSIGVLPYSHDLRLLPDYLQQLIMESNGKGVNAEGKTLDHRTCATLWGSQGTIGQHSFHQLLHQGTEYIPIDFILPLKSHSKNKLKQAHLVSNCLAQSKALTEGKNIDQAKKELLELNKSEKEANELAPHKVIPGNRPNTIIGMDKLTPNNLGSLIALYEHKVFVQSVLWDINAFDQWGVELGKQLSTPIFETLTKQNPNQELKNTDEVTAFWCEEFLESDG